MFLYIGLMDWWAGHLTVIVGTGVGRAFANENCPQGGVFDHIFSNARGLPEGNPRGSSQTCLT